MTFEETFSTVMGADLLKAFNPEQLALFRTVALTFYKCGEQQGVTNVALMVETALAGNNATDKGKMQ